MSGGPQVFLGATTFLSDCVAVRFPAAACALWGRAALYARGRRPAREPSAPRASLGASPRSPARPRHRPRAPQPGPAGLAAASNRAALGMTRPPARLGGLTSFGAAPRSPPVPSGPSGALHTCGAWCVAGCGGSVFGQTPQASPRPLLTSLLSSPNVACNSPTTLSDHELTTLELQRFQTISQCRPIQLHAIILGSGHMAAHGCRRSFA